MNNIPLHTTHENWACMPHHIYNNIASHLNSKDYSRFRLSCLSVSQSLDSFETLRQKSNNPACSKKFKDHCDNLLNDKKIRDALTNKETSDIRSALKNCHVEFSPNHVFTMLLQTDYSRYQKIEEIENAGEAGEAGEADFKKTLRVANTIDTCRMTICNDSPPLERNNSTYLSSFISVSSSASMLRSGIKFIYLTDETLPVNNIFSGFNKAFEKTDVPEKYIAATMANELKDHWLKNPPDNICQNDMLAIPEKHAVLFSLGKKAKIIATELINTAT